MPKTKFQDAVFSIMMAITMAYAMGLYNLSMQNGGMSYSLFVSSLKDLVIMAPIVILIEKLIVGRLARKCAFRIFRPQKDNPFLLTILISCFTMWMMCPLMSAVATLLFKHPGTQFFPVWIDTVAHNFPMAFFWQLFFAGPLVRFLFRCIFARSLKAEAQKEQKPEQAVVAK